MGGVLQAKLVPNGLGQLEPTGYSEYVPSVRLKIYCDGGFSHESTGRCRAQFSLECLPRGNDCGEGRHHLFAPSGKLVIAEDVEAASLKQGSVVAHRVAPDRQSSHAARFKFECREREPAAGAQYSPDLCQRSCYVRRVLDCVDRHNTIDARRVEAGSLECSLPEGGCRNVELAGALGGALDGNG